MLSAWVRNRRNARGDGGQASELAIAAPALFAILLLLAQFVVWAHGQTCARATAGAAAEAARSEHGTAAAGRARAEAVLAQLGTGVLIQPETSVVRNAGSVRVTVTARAQRVLPVAGLTLPIKGSATAPVERFVPEQGGAG